MYKFHAYLVNNDLSIMPIYSTYPTNILDYNPLVSGIVSLI